uniref:ribosomal protein S2 n=1 Tax=Cyperus esculentus TaxID=1053340 RepID=UPI001D10FF90|nr:ribosomal protein S2 [Cyperus esculentus]YP_010200533.1 ribosomal protein S2 [Cyperus esculentus]UAL49964.1 ribosomal protein S2 [Cyperus esculentus]UAL49971.1 ribosomal protein S2 [Cyperus esculentus]
MRKLLILTSTTLFSANAHLGHRVTFPHIKVYTCGSRNRIAILDSDKILICLRNALLFLGSIIRTKRGRFFLLNTQNVFIYEIMDEMANLIQDSQWKIGAFLNSPSKKNIRSRTNKITLGFHQKPDCVLILDADRKSSVIVEADRSQIPIVSLVDSTTPLRSFQRITYPIPANNSIQFVYLFANLLTKKQQQKRNFSSSAKSKGKHKSEFTFFFFSLFMVFTTCVTFFFISFFFPASLEIYKELGQTFIAWLCCLLSSTRSLFSELRGRRLAPLGMDPSGGSSVGEFDPNGQTVVQMDDDLGWDNLDPILEIPPAEVRKTVNSLPSSSSLPTSLPTSSSLPTDGNSSQIPKHNIAVIGEDYGEKALERIDKKFQEISIRKALPDYMAQFHNASVETLERELKLREKSIYQKHLSYYCFKKYDYKMPIIDDVRGLLNRKEEEQKVHVLISQILQYQGRQPTLSEIWVLEKQLEHPHFRYDLLKHVFPEYVTK